jgi:hypothetical protein
MFIFGKTQVYEILKKKMKFWCGGKTANKDINEIVWEWYVSVRAKNRRVSVPMVQEYAKKVAEKLGKTEFNFVVNQVM